MFRLLYKGVFRYTWHQIGKSDKKTHAGIKPIENINLSVVHYIDDKDKNHLMNILRKQGRDDVRPLLIDIHGGGWMYGDKDLNLFYNQWFADKGYVVASMTYPLVFSKRIDVIVQDLFASMNYLFDHAEEYHIDKNRIYLTGDSAGGHLSLLCLAISQSPRLQGIYHVKPLPFTVKACVLTHAVPYVKDLDFLPTHPHLNKNARDEFLALMCGGNYKSPKNILYSNCSMEDFRKEMKVLPPIFVTTSVGDKELSPKTNRMKDELIQDGHQVEYYCVPDPKFVHVHNVTDPTDPLSVEVNEKALAFCEAHR